MRTYSHYNTCTQVYKEKLRELKKVSRSLFRRVDEAEKRPRLIASLKESLNISHDFVTRIKNLTDDLQIFTEVEINTLDTLINETVVSRMRECMDPVLAIQIMV